MQTQDVQTSDISVMCTTSTQVKLFNYPVVVTHAPSRTYGGHSSFVMNVRWAADESYAVSVGGKDRSILQWKMLEKEKKVGRE